MKANQTLSILTAAAALAAPLALSAEILVQDDFTNATDPQALGYYGSGASCQRQILNGKLYITSTFNALDEKPGGAIKGFSPVELANEGDKLVLTFAIDCWEVWNARPNVRFGFLNIGAPVKAHIGGGADGKDTPAYFGAIGRLSQGSTEFLVSENNPDIVASHLQYEKLPPIAWLQNPSALMDGEVYQYRLEVERVGTGVQVTGVVNGLFWEQVTASGIDTQGAYTTFDAFMVAMAVRGLENDFYLLNPVVEFVAGSSGGATWADYAVDELGNADTTPWLGWVNVSGAPWIWSYSLNKYLFLEEGWVTGGGGWAYVPN